MYTQTSTKRCSPVEANSPAPAGQTYGKTSKRIFDSLGRLERNSVYVNTTEQSYVRYEFPTNGVQSKVYAPLVDVDGDSNIAEDEVYSESWSDGAGRTLRSRTEHPGSIGGWAATLVEYDILGQVKRQSVPTEVSVSGTTWTPAGDDSAGYRWTYQKYDWKGRVVRKINTDGADSPTLNDSDVLISYDGCGCAGGLIRTVESEKIVETDWQGNNPVTLGRRKQRMHEDVLGRTWKVEILNWNGTLYSTTASKFNGRDQAVAVTQTEQSTSVNQVTSATYDGHGRLQSQHRPEQDANKSTIYEYYPDDSIHVVTDARGATTSNVYNSRGLLEGISYGAPANSGIYVPSSVNVVFDNLGNRTQMTDETGTVSYQYDQLSQLVSETKQFAGLSNSFSLGYQYGLGGQLKSMTNADGTSVTYLFDKTGRLTNVNGQGFEHKNAIWSGGTPTYTTYVINQIAEDIQYRAWGAIRHAEFQDGRQYDITYNARLKPYEYTMPNKISKRYSYYADGTVLYAQDLIDNRNDRLFRYDHIGRVTKAYGGYVARGEQPNLSSPAWYDLFVPIKNDYVYNAFSNPTSRKEVSSRMYRTDVEDSWPGVGINYTNNRGTEIGPNPPTWNYDADGRLVEEIDIWGTSLNKVEYAANGQARKVTVKGNDVLDRKTSHSDAEGKPVKETMYTSVQMYDENGAPLDPAESTSDRYYLTSTVLGGSVASLIYENGNIGHTTIFAGGRKIANYYPNTGSYSKFIWEHSDPNGISGYGSSYDSRDYWAGSPTDDLTLPGKKEYEPNGMEVTRLPNMSDIVSSGGGSTGWTPGEAGGGWENFDCVWDGVNVPCGWVDHYTNSGDDSPVIQAPANSVAAIWSNSQRRFVGWAVWDPYAAQNGLAFLGRDSLGWLPTNVSYTPGSGLTGENVYQWFGGFSGSRLGSSEGNPSAISEKAVQLHSMIQGIALSGANYRDFNFVTSGNDVAVHFKSRNAAKESLKDLAKGKCGEMLSKLLKTIKEERNLGYSNDVRANDMLTLFDNLVGQKEGGIILNVGDADFYNDTSQYFTDSDQAKRLGVGGGGGGLTGAFGVVSNATGGRIQGEGGAYMYVYPYPTGYSRLSPYKAGAFLDRATENRYRVEKVQHLMVRLVHEMFHGAGKNISFTHEAMDTAAGIVDPDLAGKGNGGSIFDAFVSKHCTNSFQPAR